VAWAEFVSRRRSDAMARRIVLTAATRRIAVSNRAVRCFARLTLPAKLCWEKDQDPPDDSNSDSNRQSSDGSESERCFCHCSVVGAERSSATIAILEHATRRKVQQGGLRCVQREGHRWQALHGKLERHSARHGDGQCSPNGRELAVHSTHLHVNCLLALFFFLCFFKT